MKDVVRRRAAVYGVDSVEPADPQEQILKAANLLDIHNKKMRARIFDQPLSRVMGTKSPSIPCMTSRPVFRGGAATFSASDSPVLREKDFPNIGVSQESRDHGQCVVREVKQEKLHKVSDPPAESRLESRASSAESQRSRRAKTSRVREWRVQVSKTGPLGLETAEEKASLIIGRVSAGPIHDWNAAQGSDLLKVVRRGDRIHEVNGVRGDAQELLQEIGSSERLDISLSRLMEFRITNLPVDHVPLGIDFETSSTQCLIIKAIGKGAAQTVNKWLKPDCELRPMDRIIQVNGAGGNADELAELIGSAKSLSLLVRRPV